MINGAFEAFAGAMIGLHCRRVWIDKKVRGASIVATLFFTAWGFWNLFYYPNLGQTFSFYGGLVVVAANAVWLTLMWYYRDRALLTGFDMRVEKYDSPVVAVFKPCDGSTLRGSYKYHDSDRPPTFS
jgi:hypothetical protein